MERLYIAGARLALVCALTLVSCTMPDRAVGRQAPNGLPGFPPRILWAWERPEDFRANLDAATGIAYLASTVRLRADRIHVLPRRQPLRVPENTPLIAVVRVEAQRGWSAGLRRSDAADAAQHLTRATKAPRVRALQIDFDATASQRAFYADLLHETRRQLPAHLPITVTALASWCMERWLDTWPIAEAVPMLFRMGHEERRFRSIGAHGRWRANACRGAVGLSTDEPQVPGRGRRVYMFNPDGWTGR